MKKTKLAIIGGGGHASVLIDILSRYTHFSLIGYTDNIESKVMPLPYLGKDSALRAYSNREIVLVNAIGSARQPVQRYKVFNKFLKYGYQFPNVLHASAIVSPGAELKNGVQVMAGAIINTGTLIEANTIINTASVIEHDCRVGPHTHIASGAILAGGVLVGACCHIGSGAIIRQGLSLGDNCLIGSGSVVTKDFMSDTIAWGVPAKPKAQN